MVDRIQGKRVALRSVEERDYPLILRWQNQPDVWRNMDYEHRFSPEDIEAEARADREGYSFVIEVEGHPIGRIGLNQFRKRDRICSLYLFIGEPEFWGKGYGPDAVMTLLSEAFDRLGLHQVELWCLADNDPARKAYEKCGFVREATLRERSFNDGRFVDRVVMSVNRDEFDATRKRWDR